MLIICILYEIIQLFYISDPPTECNAYFLTIPKIGLLPHLGTIAVISHAFIIYTAHGHLHFYCTDCSALRKDSVFSPAVFSPGTLTPLSRAVDVRGFPETRWSPAGVCPASTVRHKSRTANVESRHLPSIYSVVQASHCQRGDCLKHYKETLFQAASSLHAEACCSSGCDEDSNSAVVPLDSHYTPGVRSFVGEALKSQGHLIVTKYFLKNANEHPDGEPRGI